MSIFVQWAAVLAFLFGVHITCTKYVWDARTQRIGNIITAVGCLLVTGLYGTLAVEYPSKNQAPLTPKERIGVLIEDNDVKFIPVQESTSPAQTYQEMRKASRREIAEQLKDLRATTTDQ